jgi:hypothetical protein
MSISVPLTTLEKIEEYFVTTTTAVLYAIRSDDGMGAP